MKKYIVSAIAVLGLLAASSVASAQTTLSGAAGTAVDNVKVSRTGDNMRVRMDVDLSRVDIPKNKAYILTPVLANATSPMKGTAATWLRRHIRRRTCPRPYSTTRQSVSRTG